MDFWPRSAMATHVNTSDLLAPEMSFHFSGGGKVAAGAVAA
jgi:hypothetical protein